jgi:hypothetical protein
MSNEDYAKYERVVRDALLLAEKELLSEEGHKRFMRGGAYNVNGFVMQSDSPAPFSLRIELQRPLREANGEPAGFLFDATADEEDEL